MLLVFGWVMVPVHTMHDLFADHNDTADNYCLVNHAHLGTHVEEAHINCDILDINTPVYFIPDLVLITQIVATVSTSLLPINENKECSFSVCNLPSRAPPVVA